MIAFARHLLFLVCFSFCRAAASEEKIGEKIDPYVSGPEQPGLVVGLQVAGGEPSFFMEGARKRGSQIPLDASTRFEIGSLSKVLTAALLSEMAGRGEVSLDETLASLAPVAFRSADVGRITLVELASHTSGLPRLPTHPEFALRIFRNFEDPYHGTSLEELWSWIGSMDENTRLEKRFSYSNLGPTLLGHLLARRAGKSYAQLVEERILAPLNLHETRLLSLSDPHLADGHLKNGVSTPHWNFAAFAPAGGWTSTARDLLRFVEACRTGRFPFLKKMLAPVAPRNETDAVAQGWFLSSRHGDTIHWHTGGTGGFQTFMGFSQGNERSVVVLANRFVPVTSLGTHLANPQAPHKPPTIGAFFWLVGLGTALLYAVTLWGRRASSEARGRLMAAVVTIECGLFFAVTRRTPLWGEPPEFVFWLATSLCAGFALRNLVRVRMARWLPQGTQWFSLSAHALVTFLFGYAFLT